MADVKLSKLKSNKQNPRIIRDAAFLKLVDNLTKYPKFLEKRPIVIQSWDNPVILAGNMRFAALKHLGYKTIPETWVNTADDFTEDESRAFMLLDNSHFGQWDYETLANDWDIPELEDLNVFIPDLNAPNEDGTVTVSPTKSETPGEEDDDENEIGVGLRIEDPYKPTTVRLDFLTEDDFRLFNEHIYDFGNTKEDGILNLIRKTLKAE